MPYADKEKLYEAQRKHREKNKLQSLEYLATHPCVDCGESDPVVLDYDHIDPKLKSFNVGRRLCGSTTGWLRILEEIEKCEVRCANCHRRKTARDQQWFKLASIA